MPQNFSQAFSNLQQRLGAQQGSNFDPAVASVLKLARQSEELASVLNNLSDNTFNGLLKQIGSLDLNSSKAASKIQDLTTQLAFIYKQDTAYLETLNRLAQAKIQQRVLATQEINTQKLQLNQRLEILEAEKKMYTSQIQMQRNALDNFQRNFWGPLTGLFRGNHAVAYAQQFASSMRQAFSQIGKESANLSIRTLTAFTSGMGDLVSSTMIDAADRFKDALFQGIGNFFKSGIEGFHKGREEYFDRRRERLIVLQERQTGALEHTINQFNSAVDNLDAKVRLIGETGVETFKEGRLAFQHLDTVLNRNMSRSDLGMVNRAIGTRPKSPAVIENIVKAPRASGEQLDLFNNASGEMRNAGTGIISEGEKVISEGGRFFSRIGNIFSSIGNSIPFIGSIFSGIFRTVTSIIPVISGVISSGISALGSIAQLATEKLITMKTEQNELSTNIEKEFGDVNGRTKEFLYQQEALMKFGLTLQEVQESFGAIHRQFGDINQLTEDQIQLQIRWGKLFSLNGDELGNFFKIMKSNGSFGVEDAKQFNGEVQKFATDYGVSYKEIMRDVAKNTEWIAEIGSPKMVTQFAKADAELRSMGLHIDTMVKATGAFQDFSSAVENTFRLNAALGTSLDPVRMHIMAMQGDVAGIQQSIFSNLKNVQSLNVIQVRAISQALGISGEEVRKMYSGFQSLRDAMNSLGPTYQTQLSYLESKLVKDKTIKLKAGVTADNTFYQSKIMELWQQTKEDYKGNFGQYFKDIQSSNSSMHQKLVKLVENTNPEYSMEKALNQQVNIQTQMEEQQREFAQMMEPAIKDLITIGNFISRILLQLLSWTLKTLGPVAGAIIGSVTGDKKLGQDIGSIAVDTANSISHFSKILATNPVAEKMGMYNEKLDKSLDNVGHQLAEKVRTMGPISFAESAASGIVNAIGQVLNGPDGQAFAGNISAAIGFNPNNVITIVNFLGSIAKYTAGILSFAAKHEGLAGGTALGGLIGGFPGALIGGGLGLAWDVARQIQQTQKTQNQATIQPTEGTKSVTIKNIAKENNSPEKIVYNMTLGLPEYLGQIGMGGLNALHQLIHPGVPIPNPNFPIDTSKTNNEKIGPVQKAFGGLIQGKGTSISDSIPAMLSNGEYVIPANIVSKFGISFFDRIADKNKLAFGGMPNLKESNDGLFNLVQLDRFGDYFRNQNNNILQSIGNLQREIDYKLSFSNNVPDLNNIFNPKTNQNENNNQNVIDTKQNTYLENVTNAILELTKALKSSEKTIPIYIGGKKVDEYILNLIAGKVM